MLLIANKFLHVNERIEAETKMRVKKSNRDEMKEKQMVLHLVL